MKKLFMLFAALAPILAFADKGADVSKYLAGAVPTENGKVVFEETRSVPGQSQAQIYQKLKAFMETLIAQADEAHQPLVKLTMDHPNEGMLVMNQAESIVFKAKKWEADEAETRYRIMAYCTDGQYRIRVQDIEYKYENLGTLTAERWITDVYALSKNGQKLRKDTGKFRRYTVDRIAELFAEAAKAVE